jgi:hypothetical protein
MTLDISDFYVNTPMERYEYMRINLPRSFTLRLLYMERAQEVTDNISW